ncbi:MAG TPA: DUF3501 family protein [Rhodospirillales bacterium]|nr:DUF3501 family protein [Rhodospirillales bacterium]
MTLQIDRSDILPMDQYARVRDARRRAIAETKKHRRVHVGPDITFYFENRETMLHQVHEMLAVEKGGEAQIEDELRAYNPLIPRGRELVATMMIEIDDALRRDRVLGQLGGIEAAIAITIGSETIRAVAESDVERTTADGKTSSVHFLRFPFTDAQAVAFRTPGTAAILAITHPNYGHMAAITEPVRTALAADFA